MGSDLSEPLDIGQWFQRIFSPRSIVVAMVVMMAAVSELRFDWIEKSVGAYLVTTNDARPESGAIWDKGHRSVSARDTLEQLVADRMASKREAQTAESFAQILQSLSASDQVVISADHFRQLYTELPAELAGDILSPFAMISLVNAEDWERTVFQKSGVGVSVYLVNAANGVLRQLSLPDALVDRIGRSGLAASKQLEDIPALSHRIYPARQFFEALEALPEDVRRNIVPWPETLLETGGRISRVGIADEIRDGLIDIGFEVAYPNRHEVLIMEGKDWAVWRLGALLGGSQQRADASTGAESGAGRLEVESLTQ